MTGRGLAETQRAFQAHVLTGDGAILDDFAAAGRLAPIYVNAYEARLVEVLAHDFEVTARHLGDEAFQDLARAYVAVHRSRSRNARDYGRAFPDFAAAHPIAAQVPELADLTRFERALRDAFDAADAAPLGVEAMAGIPPDAWDGLRLTFHPSVAVETLAFEVSALWRDDGDDPGAVRALARPTDHLIWRRGRQPVHRPIDGAEASALALARAGASFGDLCLALAADLGEEAGVARAAQCLRDWIEPGLVIGLDAPGEAG